MYFVGNQYLNNLACRILGEEEDLTGNHFLGVTVRDYIEERNRYAVLIRDQRRSEELAAQAATESGDEEQNE